MVLAEAQQYAQAGVEEATILAVLGARHGFDEAKLKADGNLSRLKEAVLLGHEVCRAELLVQIKRRSTRTLKNDGSVNALSLRARNLLDWDKQTIQDEAQPDLTTAHAKLELELQKNAASRTAILGRPVTELDVLYQFRVGRWPWEAEAPP